MTARTQPTPPHVYIECDIPDGITLVEWRRSRRKRPAGGASARRLFGLGR